jgi:hypothetical protein
MLLNGRAVVDVEVEGVDFKDYPDFCDAYFASAVYADDSTELTEDELLLLGQLYEGTLIEMASECYMCSLDY